MLCQDYLGSDFSGAMQTRFFKKPVNVQNCNCYRHIHLGLSVNFIQKSIYTLWPFHVEMLRNHVHIEIMIQG